MVVALQVHPDSPQLLLGGGQLLLEQDVVELGTGGSAWTRVRWKNLFLGAGVVGSGGGGLEVLRELP